MLSVPAEAFVLGIHLHLAGPVACTPVPSSTAQETGPTVSSVAL
jgi:hypothetical protein